MNHSHLLDINEKKKELIDNYKQKQDLYRQQIDYLKSTLSNIHQDISQESQNIKKTGEKLREKAKNYMNDCAESLTEKNKGKEIVDIKDLVAYLKAEKEVLKKLSDQSQTKPQNQLDIHTILRKAKLESTLSQLKKKQLEEQIKYLQTNVISKGTLIYNAAVASPISNSEEKEINQRLQNSINELQRVISLSILCNQSSDQSSKIQTLEAQSQRLKDCENFLTAESQKLGKLLKYFESEALALCEKLPLPCFISSQNNQNISLQIDQETISEYELDDIIAFDLPKGPMVSKLSHRFDDWEQEIDFLKKRFKKVEKML